MAGAIPTRDGDLRTFAVEFSGKISADPVARGFTVTEATQLASVTSDYDQAYALIADWTTRTRPRLIDKDVKKDVLVGLLRSFIRRIRANPNLSDQEKADLKVLPVDREPTPVARPATRPIVNVVGSLNLEVVIRLADELTPNRRAKPRGYAGAEVFSYVAEAGVTAPPADLEQWRYESQATRSTYTVGFNPSDVGKTIWIVARWFSRRGEAGPQSVAATTVLAATPGQQAA